jgi:thioredoxin 1
MEKITNRKDLSQYIKEKKNTHTIIKVSASWCGPCKKMKPLFNKLLYELVKKNENANIGYLKMDYDNDKDCCNFLKVRGIPHISYFKDGLLNQEMVGFDPEKLSKLFLYIDKQIQE